MGVLSDERYKNESDEKRVRIVGFTNNRSIFTTT